MKKTTFLLVGILISGVSFAQRIVEETYQITEQSTLSLDFPFASVIDLKSWDKNEVFVKVSVSINDNEDNDLFKLLDRSGADTYEIYTDKDAYKENSSSKKRNCWDSEIEYQVFIPRKMMVEVESISGDILYEYLGKPVMFKTISGDIELKVAAKLGATIEAKTISGEIYSNMDIEHTDGKKGLNQIVGMKVRGKLNNGGENLQLETISGDIFLREI